MLALTILNVCAVFYFLFQVVSVTIAEKPESLYPYDFVCIADDGDDAIFDRIKNGYQAKIIEYPMVRVANADKTEQNEGVQQGKRPQGQQIGISESTYKQLKKYVDPSYKEEAMHLDRNGKKIYLVHQQDRSVKAQPVETSVQPSIGASVKWYVPAGRFTKVTESPLRLPMTGGTLGGTPTDTSMSSRANETPPEPFW